MKRWMPFLLWFVLVAGIIIGADRGLLTSLLFQIDRIPFGDKLGHFVLVGLLAFFLNHALGRARLPAWGGGLLVGGVIVAVAITLEEISQIWIPQRHFDYGDLLANYAGICLAGLIHLRPKAKASSRVESPGADESFS